MKPIYITIILSLFLVGLVTATGLLIEGELDERLSLAQIPLGDHYLVAYPTEEGSKELVEYVGVIPQERINDPNLLTRKDLSKSKAKLSAEIQIIGNRGYQVKIEKNIYFQRLEYIKDEVVLVPDNKFNERLGKNETTIRTEHYYKPVSELEKKTKEDTYVYIYPLDDNKGVSTNYNKVLKETFLKEKQDENTEIYKQTIINTMNLK